MARTSSDADVLKALNHPVRRQAMNIFDNEVASPKEVAARLGLSIPSVSYHVGILRDLGLIKIVRETPRRGAVEHYYKAVTRTLSVRQVVDWVLASDQSRPRSWSARLIELDREGEEQLRASMERLWRDLDRAEQQSQRRAARAGAKPASRHAVGVFATET